MKSMFFYLLMSLMVITASFFIEVTVASDKVEFLGDQKSNTTWGHLPTESFLSFKDWKEESDFKSQVQDWEKIVRERNHREIAGRIYQCVGTCRVDRGAQYFPGSHRTALFEGDELQTVGDSYAWVFMFDGTMIRMSPRTSITFNEFNVGVKENFISARVNGGNIVWLSRNNKILSETNVRETDISFFPYSEYESLPKQEHRDYEEDDLLKLITTTNPNFNHYKEVNDKILSNNAFFGQKKTYAVIVMPAATIMGYSPNVEVVSILGGKTFVKKRSELIVGLLNSEVSPDTLIQLRGFENKTLTPMLEDQWFTINETGRTSEPTDSENSHWLNVGEFITKRIPSIFLGREIFLERYSEFAFRKEYDAVKLARNDGYRLWGTKDKILANGKDEQSMRLEFLKEYFRRLETSNLVTTSRFRERLLERGEKDDYPTYGNYFFITALNRYYRAGEKNKDNSGDKETGEVLNSTTKLLWKKMHGIR